MTRISVLALILCAGCQAQVMDGLNATAWQQTSVEYRAVALQSWKLAHLALPTALKDKKWTAAIEQTGDYEKLPPAIIVDIDETIIDNSPGQARFLLEGNGRYARDMWQKWTAERRAKPVPGALEFLTEADKKGVTVFYVTNRGAVEAADTKANLEMDGFPVKGSTVAEIGDALLLGGEKPEWTADKTVRRALIAKHYRIIMLCGDDLNDFFSARVSPEERAAGAKKYASWFGERWIVLPNPMYGSWEDSLFDYDRALTPEEIQQRKLKALRRE